MKLGLLSPSPLLSTPYPGLAAMRQLAADVAQKNNGIGITIVASDSLHTRGDRPLKGHSCKPVFGPRTVSYWFVTAL